MAFNGEGADIILVLKNIYLAKIVFSAFICVLSSTTAESLFLIR